jgi:hypothetical protein
MTRGLEGCSRFSDLPARFGRAADRLRVSAFDPKQIIVQHQISNRLPLKLFSFLLWTDMLARLQTLRVSPNGEG